MKPNETVQIRQEDVFYPQNPGYYGDAGAGFPYPGIENPYGAGRANLPVPYTPQPPAVGGSSGGGGGGGGLLSSLNFGQIKGFVDKMGGIDGIVSTMTRVQKMVSSFQQMAPMLKLLMGSFGAKAASKSLKGGARSRKRGRKKGSSVHRKYRSSYRGKAYKGKKRR